MEAIKAFVVAALAVLIGTAFIGASSAMAESTQLCSMDEALCVEEHVITHVHEATLSGAKAKLLTSIGTVACDVLFLGDSVGLSNRPLLIKGSFTYSNCGCTVEETGGGTLVEILKLGHEVADVTGESEVHVDCSEILNCYYNGEELLGTGKGSLLSPETNGSVTITEQTVKKVKGLFCPEGSSKLDIVTTPLSATYLSNAGNTTSLCSNDPGTGPEEPCSKGSLVSHVHETTLSGAKAKLLTSIANVECDVLFLGSAVSSLSAPLVIEGNLTYSNCGACTVTEEGGPVVIEVFKLGHESSDVTGEGEVHVNCTGLNCYYSGKGLLGTGKGPLLSPETNGSVTITEQTVTKVKGLFCPAVAKLDITTTPLSATYITR